MNATDFKKLQQKIEDKKAEKNKALGMKEQLESQLKKDFEINDIKDAEKTIVILTDEIKDGKKKYDSLMEELDSITEWTRLG
jgi:predicted RNase H-like nuclease (RuvC/YqgF family)